MQIEVWSDIMCPFCFIGSYQLDLAIEEYKVRHNKNNEEINIEWRSFLLQPDLEPQGYSDIFDYKTPFHREESPKAYVSL